ncbi:hypothetical protein DL98DRAFT_250524 [Cadophora sp. DSE1049]|nr:hypothetical protein DL98DRAFT_250524 [Cadophora sp. DSE1049]
MQNLYYQPMLSKPPPELDLYQTRPAHRAFSVDETKSEALNSGIEVLRNLIRGQISTTVNDTLMFLAISKSIATVRCFHNDGATIYMAQFKEELVRWQLVFSSNPDSLSKFRPLPDLWQIDLESTSNEEASPLHPEALLSLQDMALRVVGEGASLLIDRGSGRSGTLRPGLLLSQRHWREGIRNKADEGGSGINRKREIHDFDTHESGDRVTEAALPQSRSLHLCPGSSIPHVSPLANLLTRTSTPWYLS